MITGFSFKFKQKKKNSDKTRVFELTDDFVAKHAQAGETWEQARLRLKNEAETGKFTMSQTD